MTHGDKLWAAQFGESGVAELLNRAEAFEDSLKEKGVVRSEGKEYVVQDGDVLLFRFNV